LFEAALDAVISRAEAREEAFPVAGGKGLVETCALIGIDGTLVILDAASNIGWVIGAVTCGCESWS
jgi:hypothetical protein